MKASESPEITLSIEVEPFVDTVPVRAAVEGAADAAAEAAGDADVVADDDAHPANSARHIANARVIIKALFILFSPLIHIYYLFDSSYNKIKIPLKLPLKYKMNVK
jgi:hypothetical protein